MENLEFSFRELIEKSTVRGYEIPEFKELKKEFETGRRGKTFITGSFLPLHSRVVDTTSGAASATMHERIKANSLAFNLGAKSVSGLTADVLLSTETLLPNSQWVTEVGAVIPQVDPTFNGERIAPMRLYASVPISQSLMATNGTAFEEFVADAISRSQSEALDRAILTGDGITSPLGLLNDPAIQVDNLGADGRALTLADILEAEETACPNHVNSEAMRFAYLMNAQTRKALKQTPKVAGGDNMIMASNFLNGYPAAVSQHIPGNIALGAGANLSALIYGNFNDILIMYWGGLDILVDHYSSARTSTIWLHCSSFMNVKILQPGNFNVINGIVAP